MRQAIVRQFKHPNGVLGRLAAWIMAHRNVRRNVWVVSLLGIEPHHHVLEVGCGPGVALEQAAELVRPQRTPRASADGHLRAWPCGIIGA